MKNRNEEGQRGVELRWEKKDEEKRNRGRRKQGKERMMKGKRRGRDGNKG